MAKLKLQEEVLHALEINDKLPFSDQQRKLVSAIKSGQSTWLATDPTDPHVWAIAATLIHKLKSSYEDVARALILVVDKERADLYAEAFELLGKHTDLRVWTAYTGPQLLKQKEDIYFGADVVIATPQRLNDLLNIEGFNSASVQTCVLDNSKALLRVGTNGYTQRIADSIPYKQRICISEGRCKATRTYMERFAFPYEKHVFESEDLA